jgi:hypothetical protein
MAKRITCASCGGPINSSELYYGDEATHYERKSLCEACYYEDEPVATLYQGQNEEPYHITQSRNDTDGKFRALWHSTDPWRGRYQLSSESHAMVFSDAILSYHESEAMLKELNDRAIERLSQAEIDFYRAFLRTSNLFCTDYDIWVKRDPAQILVSHLILEKIKTEVGYDNPLYSTGIILDRDDFKKLQSLLGGKYKIERDSDVMRLAQEKGNDLVEEIKGLYGTEMSPKGTQGDNGA